MPVPRPDADRYVLQEVDGHDVKPGGIERAVSRQQHPDIVTRGVKVGGKGGDYIAKPAGLCQRCKLG
jgi:hypothetical protein